MSLSILINEYVYKESTLQTIIGKAQLCSETVHYVRVAAAMPRFFMPQRLICIPPSAQRLSFKKK